MASRLNLTRLLRGFRSIFRKPFRSFLLEQKYRVIPAFELHGKRYFMFADQTEVPTGRQFAALMVYNEMEMRCDRSYLELHCKAMDKLLGDPKKIHIGYISQLNANLKDRLELMVVPDFIYKLASVVFFDQSESPYQYDSKYNEDKIAGWKKDSATLDFFLRTPLTRLVPFLKAQEGVSPIYSVIAEQVEEIHHKLLTDILSERESTTA
jgi:hypothetical protein